MIRRTGIAASAPPDVLAEQGLEVLTPACLAIAAGFSLWTRFADITGTGSVAVVNISKDYNEFAAVSTVPTSAPSHACMKIASTRENSA